MFLAWLAAGQATTLRKPSQGAIKKNRLMIQTMLCIPVIKITNALRHQCGKALFQICVY